MRLLLWFCAIFAIIYRPEPGAEVVYEGVMMFKTLLMPVMAPIFFMLLLLDSLMSTVWITQTMDEEKKRYITNVIINLIVAATLAYSWVPFLASLGKK